MEVEAIDITESLTYSTVRIESEHINGSCSTGTGFIVYMCHNKTMGKAIAAVVTNKHVVKDIKKTKFVFCTQDENGIICDQKPFVCNFATDNWIMHPNSDVDLCCLDITHVLSSNQACIKTHNLLQERGVGNDLNKSLIYHYGIRMDLIPDNEELEKWGAIEDLIMIGYPDGIYDKYNNKPVVRKGISATHIKKNYNGKKEFLIDMACFPGSSGSPVFALIDKTNVENNTISWGKNLFFVGILYAGPQHFVVGEVNGAEKIKTVSKIPNNLGCVIKSSELNVFENILYDKYPHLKVK